MSLLRNIFLSGLLLLAACGFEPMYGEKNQQVLSGGVQIETSRDAMGQQFQQNLEDRLNPGGLPSTPGYKLSVKLDSVAEPIGVARDGTVSRFNVTLNSTYILTRISDNKVIKTGNIHHVSSYNNQTNQYFSTYISEKDSLARGVIELSELYRQRIGALLLRDQKA